MHKNKKKGAKPPFINFTASRFNYAQEMCQIVLFQPLEWLSNLITPLPWWERAGRGGAPILRLPNFIGKLRGGGLRGIVI